MRAGAPGLSVVMPVHNALPHLDEAIESILGQSFSDFEFVILDDASTDGSRDRLRDWAHRDSRIRLLHSKKNLGPVGSSQRVASAALAPMVARMDADDISLPGRLAEQFQLLRLHPDVGVVGCLSDLIDGKGRIIRGAEIWRLASSSWSVPFAHGAIMYRRDLFERVGGYRPEAELWEDQDLIERMAELAKVIVIPRTLYRVRQTPRSTRSMTDLSRQEQALDRMYRLRHPDRGGQPAGSKVDPRVFVGLGSVMLWSGERPRLLRRLLRRGRLRLDLPSLAALGWTAWAAASPATLRRVLNARLALRNRSAMRRLRGEASVEWSRPRKPVAGRRADR